MTDKWQGMRTAPKDRHVLLYARIQAFDGLTVKEPLVVSGYWDAIDGAWCSTTATWTGPFLKPSKWMPLPDPPSSKEGT